MAMIEPADIVAERYKLSREYQNEYSLKRSAAWGRPQSHKFRTKSSL